MTAPIPLPTPTSGRRTLLALHCSGAGGRAFEPYRALIGRDAHLIAPDLLGYGARDPRWPAGAPLSLDDEADRLVPLLGGCSDGVHLLGHSYGGAVALQLALRCPQRVRSLTVYEPVRFALLHRDPALSHAIRGVGTRIAALAAEGRLGEAAEIFVDYWSHAGAWSLLPAARQAAVAARMPKVGAEFGAILHDAVPAAAYGGLTMPVTVIAGGRSPAPARRVAERLVEACPGTRLVRVPHCGHMGALDSPMVVVRELPWNAEALARAA